ncbi:MAG: hypothetical protein ACJ8AI_24145 [Rhodopila sp.]
MDLYRGGNPNAGAALLDRALDKAIVAGETVLRELVQRESRLPGEWDYLRAFQRLDTQSPPLDEAIHRSLRRRLMVAEDKRPLANARAADAALAAAEGVTAAGGLPRAGCILLARDRHCPETAATPSDRVSCEGYASRCRY